MLLLAKNDAERDRQAIRVAATFGAFPLQACEL
jgi:hypothetical protein